MKIATQALTIGFGDNPAFPRTNLSTHAAIDVNEDIIVLPGGTWPLHADFTRQGPDLLVSRRDGESFAVRDYFLRGNPADIHTEGGAVLKGGFVERLVGILVPGQFV